MPVYLAVIGPSRATPAVEAAAFEVGALVAASGAILVCGGGGGAMEAACRGAKSAGGVTVGILPGATRADANPSVDIALPTGMGEARNTLVVRAADAVIAVGGGVGTLSEIGLALKMGKPVVGLGTWEVAPPPGETPLATVRRAGTPDEAVRAALGRRD
ncbi:MAG TPA: TIGR00725 family protein [Actinomycetota bacterium]|nr:TIGR00725 family protein [Actinomycetota bacterium]